MSYGLYLHVPFCKKACTYCDFHFSTSLVNKTLWIQALQKEIEIQAKKYPSDIHTLYLGGGTPSLLNQEDLQQIFETLHSNYDLALSKETTLEANPDDIQHEKLILWKQLGIDRLSVGIQSFEKEILAQYNRSHTVEQAECALGMLRDTGYFDYTLDLIFGFPGMSTATWERQLKKALSYKPQHISVYALTVEEKTALAHQVASGNIHAPEDQLLYEQYFLAEEYLASEGYEHYEVSNYALPNKRATHNSAYWSGQDYLGLGPSAHSYMQGIRWANISNNALYEKKIHKQEQWYEIENLMPQDRFNELLITGFRSLNGINKEQLNSYFASDAQQQIWWQKAEKMMADSILTCHNEKIYLNKEHWFQADKHTLALMLEKPQP